MPESIDARLQSLGLTLPAVTPTRGSFKAYVISGNMLYLSGKGAPAREPADHVPKVGAEVTAAQAQAYAKEVGLNQLAVIKEALGSLDRVKRVVKVFGDKGGHARSAVGVGSLPRGFAVEIEAVIEFE